MHRRLGGAILSQLAFPEESNQKFPWEKAQLDKRIVTTTTTIKDLVLLHFEGGLQRAEFGP